MFLIQYYWMQSPHISFKYCINRAQNLKNGVLKIKLYWVYPAGGIWKNWQFTIYLHTISTINASNNVCLQNNLLKRKICFVQKIHF